MALRGQSKICPYLWRTKEAEEEIFDETTGDEDPARSKRVTDGLLKRVKLGIATPEKA